jgi:isocitrate dehydrogenase kinase/phosphatase
VKEAVQTLHRQFSEGDLRDAIWSRVKRRYVALLADHKQPELAETFFNTVSTKILDRRYFHNDFIFVRPGVATDYLDSSPPSFRSYYPGRRRLGRRIPPDHHRRRARMRLPGHRP